MPDACRRAGEGRGRERKARGCFATFGGDARVTSKNTSTRDGSVCRDVRGASRDRARIWRMEVQCFKRAANGETYLPECVQFVTISSGKPFSLPRGAMTR